MMEFNSNLPEMSICFYYTNK